MSVAADIETMYRQYRTPLMRYLSTRVERDLIEDMLQDVFERAWAATLRGKGCHDNAMGWLMRIAHNRVVDHYRFRRGDKEVESLDELTYEFEDGDVRPGLGDKLESREPSPHECAEQAVDLEHIGRHLRVMPPAQRVTVVRRLEGYEYGEIGAALGVSAAAAKQYQFRAYETLRLMLEGA